MILWRESIIITYMGNHKKKVKIFKIKKNGPWIGPLDKVWSPRK